MRTRVSDREDRRSEIDEKAASRRRKLVDDYKYTNMASLLILSRRVGQTVMIGDDVTVTVLGASDAEVRVGINAPKGVPVHREEVYERIRAGQQIAGAGADDTIGRNRAASSEQRSRIDR